jgi:hypothetical protein
MFGLFFMALLAGVTLEGGSIQKVEPAKSIVSLSAPKTVSFVSPSLPKKVESNPRKTAKLEIQKLPLVKIFEERGLDKGQITGWSKDKEGPNSSKGEGAPDWMK